eukprot:COSAG06_NODE_2404_length_6931_cov_35.420082_4_plen_182_part_00
MKLDSNRASPEILCPLPYSTGSRRQTVSAAATLSWRQLKQTRQVAHPVHLSFISRPASSASLRASLPSLPRAPTHTKGPAGGPGRHLNHRAGLEFVPVHVRRPTVALLRSASAQATVWHCWRGVDGLAHGQAAGHFSERFFHDPRDGRGDAEYGCTWSTVLVVPLMHPHPAGCRSSLGETG